MRASFVLAVALAGGVGCAVRYLVAWFFTTQWPQLPLATAVVNVFGCLGFGFFWACAHGRWSPGVSTAVFAGFFGGFTTFSSFAFECHELLQERGPWWFLGNLVGQNVLGLLAVMVGLGLGGAVRGA